MSAAIGFVYILTNPYMDEVYKVGCTERSPHARAAELSSGTGVPAPFNVLCYIEVADFQAVERAAHKFLEGHRISSNREFFHGGLVEAVSFLWWFPKRLSFCEPYEASHSRDRGEPVVTDCGPFNYSFYEALGGLKLFEELPNPWRPMQVIGVEPSAKPFDGLEVPF